MLHAGKMLESWKEKREKKMEGRDGAREGEVDFGGRPTPNYLKYTGDATFSDIYN